MVPRAVTERYMEQKDKKNLLPVSPQRLTIGMYVAELDKPWEDTPFSFQGFEITRQQEIEALIRHCDTVFIDPDYASASYGAGFSSPRGGKKAPTAPLDTTSASAVLDLQRSRLFSQLCQSDEHDYGKPVDLRGEARRAREAFSEARRRFAKLIDAIRQGKPVQAGHCRNVVEPLATSVMRNPDALSRLTIMQKLSSQRHDRSISTAVWAAVLARYLCLPPNLLLDIASGGLLLDIGFLNLPEKLTGKPQRLQERERVALRSHVRLGQTILEEIPDLTDRVREMQLQHHERMDGSGYPDRLDADSIGPFGAIAAVIDSYDAMITDMPYRTSLASSDAVRTLQMLAGDTLSASAVEQFVQAIGMFPSGSLVQLNTGEVAIVASQDPERRLRPRLLVVTDGERDPLRHPRALNLVDVPAAGPARDARWIDKGLPIGSYGIDALDYFD